MLVFFFIAQQKYFTNLVPIAYKITSRQYNQSNKSEYLLNYIVKTTIVYMF